MKAVVLALLAMCAACTPMAGDYEGDPTENAIAVFEAHRGPISAKCREHALNIDIEYASVLAVEHACRCESDGCSGCMDHYDPREGGHVWLMDDAPPWVLAHETMHVILNCTRPDSDGDADHSLPLWKDRSFISR